MPYSHSLADRLRDCLDRYPHITEKRMFGGLGFFRQGNLLTGIWKESLVLRLGHEQATQALKLPEVNPFNPTGKSLKGWVMIHEDNIEDDITLKQWLSQAMEFVQTLPGKG
jgi:TfoX/Sxy family transcriptional regulator of competence genes